MQDKRETKNHKILNNHTAIGFILVFIWAEGLREIAAGIESEISKQSSQWPAGFIAAVFCIVLLWWFGRWYLNEFKGCLKTTKTQMNEGMKMLWPIWILAALDFMILIPVYGFEGLTIRNFAFSVAAGVGEECVFRGILVSYLMRNWGKKDRLMLVCALPSLCFGLLHFSNLVAGADFGMTVLQVVSATTFGFFASAILLRVGSIVPLILAHTLNDIVALLNTAETSGGVIVKDGVTFGDIPLMIAAALFLALGLYLLRKEKRAEIIELWDEKWSRNDMILSQ